MKLNDALAHGGGKATGIIAVTGTVVHAVGADEDHVVITDARSGKIIKITIPAHELTITWASHLYHADQEAVDG